GLPAADLSLRLHAGFRDGLVYRSGRSGHGDHVHADRRLEPDARPRRRQRGRTVELTMEPGRPLSLRDVRRMLEGVVPPAMCTASLDGVPHVNYLSHAEYVDEDHVALTYQFFNRSRQNVLATRRAALSIDDPYTGAGMVMQLEYLHTETSGPL